MSVEEPVYIQDASEVELQTIKNIGPAKAAKLVMVREVQGFLDMSDLIKITGLSQEIWEGLVNDGKVLIKGTSSRFGRTRTLSNKITELEFERQRLASEAQKWQENNETLREQMTEKDRIWQNRLDDLKATKEFLRTNPIKREESTDYINNNYGILSNSSREAGNYMTYQGKGSSDRSFPHMAIAGQTSPLSTYNMHTQPTLGTPTSLNVTSAANFPYLSQTPTGRGYSTSEQNVRSSDMKYNTRKYDKRSSKRYQESSASESDSTSDSEASDSSDSERGYRRKYRHKRKHDMYHRRKSPPTPRLPTFNGDGNWDSFIFQFERLVDRYEWSDRKARERLLDCLKDKALEFAKEVRSRDYYKLKKTMTRRFSTKEAPIAARRQLMSIRQKEGENLEEYSQRVQFLCMDGHPEAREETIDQIAVEAFLRGCRDKDAAKSAMEKNPRSIYKALKYVKASQNNQQALFGNRSTYSTRQVTFADERYLRMTRMVVGTHLHLV